ncbi:hypothetical protein C8Q76DRAFT_727002 [Earliella scabrosa]|nr:hypothetical protein C8Q76DRAFT_727002 [Earliella scabrosa]
MFLRSAFATAALLAAAVVSSCAQMICARNHTVVPGDTCDGISAKMSVSTGCDATRDNLPILVRGTSGRLHPRKPSAFHRRRARDDDRKTLVGDLKPPSVSSQDASVAPAQQDAQTKARSTLHVWIMMWERIKEMVAAGPAWAERCLKLITPYDELSAAEESGDMLAMESILARLVREWQAVGGLLLALAATYTGVFGFQKDDTQFSVDGVSRRITTLGAICAGVGLVSDGWMLLVYGVASAEKFQRLAKDGRGTYLHFCLACRVPAVCVLLSAAALVAFFLTVEWAVSPRAVLVTSVFCVMVFACLRLACMRATSANATVPVADVRGCNEA